MLSELQVTALCQIWRGTGIVGLNTLSSSFSGKFWSSLSSAFPLFYDMNSSKREVLKYLLLCMKKQSSEGLFCAFETLLLITNKNVRALSF